MTGWWKRRRGSDGKCPQDERRTERLGRDTRGDGRRRRRRKRREEVWSRNKQQQKAGKEPPAAGDAEQKAGEGGGNGGLNPPYVSRRGRVTLLRPPGGTFGECQREDVRLITRQSEQTLNAAHLKALIKPVGMFQQTEHSVVHAGVVFCVYMGGTVTLPPVGLEWYCRVFF